MLSERKKKEMEMFTICQTSGDININDRFNGTRYLTPVLFDEYYAKTPCICIGKIGNSERIFVTEDKLCYFSVTYGWGEKDGFLVVLNQGFEFKHDQPMGINELKEFVTNPPETHGFASHMKVGLEITNAKLIIQLLEKHNNVK